MFSLVLGTHWCAFTIMGFCFPKPYFFNRIVFCLRAESRFRRVLSFIKANRMPFELETNDKKLRSCMFIP